MQTFIEFSHIFWSQLIVANIKETIWVNPHHLISITLFCGPRQNTQNMSTDGSGSHACQLQASRWILTNWSPSLNQLKGYVLMPVTSSSVLEY